MRKEIARAEETAFTGWAQHNISPGGAAPSSKDFTSLAALAGGGRGIDINLREDGAYGGHQRGGEDGSSCHRHEAGHQGVLHQVLSTAIIAEQINPSVKRRFHFANPHLVVLNFCSYIRRPTRK